MAYEELMDKLYAGKAWQDIPQITDAGVLELMEQQKRPRSFRPAARGNTATRGTVCWPESRGKSSGMPFAEFLRQRIFIPLRMRNTMAHEYAKELGEGPRLRLYARCG